jgi:hypothetical protein
LENLGVHVIILEGPGITRVRIWLTDRVLAYQRYYNMDLLIFLFINKAGIIKSGK